MYIYAYCLSGTVLFLLAMMVLISKRFHIFYKQQISRELPAHNNPKVGIILPLRGSDPFLDRCLEALLEQNYSNYSIRIVVDNPEDPAREVVEKVIQQKQSDKVTLEFLNDFTDTCSLKNCALRQAYQGLPDDCEVIIQVDADAYPYPDWVNDLVSGLQDPEVGVACGIRWYSSEDSNFVNLARHAWNAGAIMQMQALNIGWGGSFAIKKEAFEKAEIYDNWGTSLFDDALCTDLILQQGYRLQVLPRVTMVNEESTSLKGCMSFIARQLLNVRLYHRAWPAVFVYGLFAFLVKFVSVISTVALLAMGETTPGLIILGSLALYYMGQAAMIWIFEYSVQSSQKKFNKPAIKHSPVTLPIGLALSLVIFPVCLIMARLTKSVTWRGITYNFTNSQNVKRINYEPFVSVDGTSTESL